MAKSKLLDFINDLTNRSSSKEEAEVKPLSGHQISSLRAHQKLVNYEIEILKGRLKADYLRLGEMVHERLLAGKPVGKTTKELRPILAQLDQLKEKIQHKQAEKNLDFSFLKEPLKTAETKPSKPIKATPTKSKSAKVSVAKSKVVKKASIKTRHKQANKKR